jgi:fatty-acyl-CoA synthase
MNARTEAAVASRATDSAWRRRTLWDVLSEHAHNRPDKLAFVMIDTNGNEFRATYGELYERAKMVSQGLAKIGVRAGDRVGLWMTNKAEWIYTYFGATRIGAVLVPLNTWLRPDEVAYVLRKSAVRHLIMLSGFRKISFVDILSNIAPEWSSSSSGQLNSRNLPDLRNVVIVGGEASSHGAAFGWDQICSAGSDCAALADDIALSVKPDDLAVVMFTSGSSGFPKGAMLEHWGLVTNGTLYGRRLGITGKDIYFNMMPFFHSNALVMGLTNMMTRGGTYVFTETKDGDAGALLLEKEKCTVLYGFPPMLQAIFEALDKKPRKIDTLWLAGAVRPSAIRGQSWPMVDEMRRRFGITNFFGAYGMTEVYSCIAATGANDTVERQEGGWGRPFDGQELRIVDPASDLDAEPGTPGEIWMRGLVFRGYYDLPEETAKAIDSDGWIHTQDLGVMDEDGYIKYVGRLKGMLKVGGENVAVEEVENVLRRFPGVVEVAVIGVPDDRYTEVPRAYIIRSNGASVDTEAMRAFCVKVLAPFKVPRDYIVVDELPMTGSGKVDRPALIRRDQDAAKMAHIQA